MKRYFPFLRGKQNEMMAVRELAERIAEQGNVIPIIEPVKDNPTTRISLDRYIEVSMPFLFICNPAYGEFASRPDELFAELIEEVLIEYDNWTPTLQVERGSTRSEISGFLDRYEDWGEDGEVAVIYNGLPASAPARALLNDGRILHHVFLDRRVGAEYVNGIPEARRVIISDPFNRQARNADYPDRELFTDMNTVAGNPRRLDFGDFSIVGDHYADTGGPAY